MSTSSDPPESRSILAQPPLETLIVQGDRDRHVLNHITSKIHGKRAVFIALAANLTIGTIKLIAGFGGRHSALLSEAMHSFADAVNSGFLLIGLQKGSRAADKTHPFGYGLETTLWAMLASVFMLLLASWSMYLGFHRIFYPEPFGNYILSASVLIFSIGLELIAVGVAADAVLSEKDRIEKRWWPKIAQASQSVRTITSPTTRFVFYEDTIALLGAIVALVAISIGEFGAVLGLLPETLVHIPDAVASILIGFMLLGLAIYLFLHNSKGLTGSSAGPQIEERIRHFVLGIPGVSQVYELKTIDYGLSGIVVHMRVEVDPDTQVKDVDDLTERIRDRIQARIGNIKEVIIEVLADETSVEWSEQFEKLIDQGSQQGILKPREERILKNIYQFTKAVVSDIMVPRTDVDCIELSASLEDLMNMVDTTGYTRIPVYETDVDNMLGVIHAKDAFAVFRSAKQDVTLRDLMRPFEIYPENKALSDLLEDFKRHKMQIAMVADEHGGFAGIVTIEDLLEEIVGEILDEYDEDLLMVEPMAPTQIIINGRCSIDELNERYPLNIPDEEFNTVGGFVFGLLGREPKEGDHAMFDELTFTVLEMDGHRVDKVQLDSEVPLFTPQPDADKSIS